MPGQIHSESAQKFYREIGASERALSILRDGLKLPFIDEDIPDFWFKNNASFFQHFEFAKNKIHEWLEAGYIEETFSRPRHISPLSVATKVTVSDEVKLRLCVDATHLNDLMISESTKMPTLETSEALIKNGDFFTVLDLKNCFFHVRLNKADEDKIAFALPLSSDPEETKYRFFRIKILAYGLKPATLVIHLLTKPCIDHLSNLDIRSVVFIDDIRVNNDSIASVSRDTQVVKDVFSKAGWTFNESKESSPSQEVYYLGFYYDSVKEKYRVHPSKLSQIERRIDEIDDGSYCAKPKDLAKIVGKIIALEIATSYIPRLCCGRYFIWTAKVITCRQDWHITKRFPRTMIQDLRRALSYAKELSGTIRHKQHVYKEFNVYPLRKNYKEYAGDGNELCGAYFDVQDPFKYSIIHYEGYDVREISSSFKELLVLFHCIKENAAKNEGNDLVYFTDSKVLYFWHRYGTSNSTVADILLRIKYVCIKKDIVLEISWKPREDYRIQLADTSCKSSTDEFAIPKAMYHKLCVFFDFQPEVDLFASTLLHRTDVFYSHSPTLGSSGANALNFPWNRRSFCHPPKMLMHQVTKKIEAEKSIDLLLIFLKTKHNTDLKRFLTEDGCFKSYIKMIVAFESKVHFPGDKPSRFMISRHSWYAMRIVKNNHVCKLKPKDIYYFK